MMALQDVAIKLSGEQVQFYQENGFIQIPNLLKPDEVDYIKQTIYKASEKVDANKPAEAGPAYYYGRVFDQRVNVWRGDERMREITFDHRFAEIARQLTQARSVRLFHDHALFKPGGPDSKPTNWHQDTVYWPMDKDNALSIWIALDDVDEHNGCLQFIPKTRNFGRLEGVDLTSKTTHDIFKLLKAGQEVEEVQVMRMKAGGVTYHDGLTFHYAGANTTDKPRHALAIIYMPEGINYNGKSHIVTDGLGLEVGKPFDHELFPILAKE